VVCHEWACRRAAGNRLKHRRLNLEVTSPLHEPADRRDDLEASLEDVTHLGIRNEVHVALTVARLGVGEPMILLGQRPKRLRQQGDLAGLHRELAPAASQHDARGADPVAEVEVFGGRETPVTQDVQATEQLQLTSSVAKNQKSELALIALRHEASCDRNDVSRLGSRLEVGVALGKLTGARRDLKTVDVGLAALVTNRVELGSAHKKRVVLYRRGALRLI